MKLITAPRAVAGTVRAETDPNAMLRSLATEVQGFQARYDNRVNALEVALQAQMDRSEANALGLGLAGGVGSDPEYSRAFAALFRSGDSEDYLRTANAAPERMDALGSNLGLADHESAARRQLLPIYRRKRTVSIRLEFRTP